MKLCSKCGKELTGIDLDFYNNNPRKGYICQVCVEASEQAELNDLWCYGMEKINEHNQLLEDIING